MFSMYERDNSSFEHFFKLILCQMYHILVIEITFKRDTLQENVTLGQCD